MTEEKIFTECPEGYYAIEGNCGDCDFRYETEKGPCSLRDCLPGDRKDHKRVIFKKIEK